jgi:hypothetical protein
MQHGACTAREVDLSTSLRAFRNLPTGVAVWQLLNPRDVRSLRFISANPAAEREMRAPLSFAVGKPVTDSFPKLFDTPVPEHCRSVVLSGSPETFGELVYQDARIPQSVLWVDCFPLPESCVGLALENITERKRLIDHQSRALQLLHRVTLCLNEAQTVLEAAQFCVDNVCTQFDLPVGRFFLADEACPSCFVPNPVWYFRDPKPFRAFRKATELYERDLTNKLALEYRTIQGQKAGLSRSLGFSVVENHFLRGVLEFSCEDVAPLDEHIFRAISNVGYQLGQVFARERLAHDRGHASGLAPSQQNGIRLIRTVDIFQAGLDGCLSLQRNCAAAALLSNELAESTRRVQNTVADLKRTMAKPADSLRNGFSTRSLAALEFLTEPSRRT